MKRDERESDGIKLIVWRDGEKRILRFLLSGHAGYGHEGEDIVCAAVSALTISAVNGLEHFMKQPPRAEDADGRLECTIQAENEEELEQAQWILQTMVLGLEEIRHVYGSQYLKIECRRWTPC